MTHEVFISYSTHDKEIAEAVCSALEAGELRCWIAPRDIQPGVKYAAALVDAINTCHVFLLVLSAASNESPQVEMEVDRAASKNIPIICLRIDNVVLSKSLEYYLSSRHWLDATKPPVEKHIQTLVKTIRGMLAKSGSLPAVPSEHRLDMLDSLQDEVRLWETPLMLVSKASQVPQGREVLVTRIRGRMVPARDFLIRYEMYVESQKRVESRHVARVIDHGEHDGRGVVVEEAPGGKRLSELVKEGQGLPEKQVLETAHQLGDTLSALYKRNLFQQVFDPQSIWLDKDGMIVVSQVGVSQGINLSRLLASGKLEGSPWHAPELIRGEPGDMRTDFYTLGVLLFFLLTGKTPDPGPDAGKTPPPGTWSPARLSQEISSAWDGMMERCLQPDPARRIQSLAEYNSKLEEISRGLETGEGMGASEDSLVGQVLGGYQLVEKLGQGGMASVYKAYESALDRYVAVKVLPSFLAGDASFAQRFRREAKAVAQLSHPNIIPIYSFGEDKGITYIAMQLMPGGTLKRPGGQTFTPSEALKLLIPVARALAYAHQRGIVHRDLKPGNILLTEDRWPVVADFGLVQMAEGSARLTSTGLGLGTPAYMSPEQGQGSRVDARSDIYSLGIVLYEMVTGDVPFHAATPMGILLKHVTEPLPSVRKVKSGIPAEVEAVIRKAAAKEEKDRYQSAEEMAAAMEQALAAITMPMKAKPQEMPVKVKPPRVEKEKKVVVKKQGTKEPFKLRLPSVRIRITMIIAAVVVALAVLGGIFGKRLLAGFNSGSLTGAAGSISTVAPNLATATAYGGAPPTLAASLFEWNKLSDLENLRRDQVNVITYQPDAPNKIYVGTQNSGIYLSDDGGESWKSSSTGLRGATILDLVINQDDPIFMYAGVYASGLYRSTDGGAHWVMNQPNINLYNPKCSDVAVDPTNSKHLYYSDGKNMFETYDGGDGWNQMDFNLSGKGLCNLQTAKWGILHMWGTVDRDGLYLSMDKGSTWNRMDSWIELFPGLTSFSDLLVWVDPYEDAKLYFFFRDDSTSERYLLRSLDKGTHWDLTTLGCTNGMAFDSLDPRIEFCASAQVIWITKDGGERWMVMEDLPAIQTFSVAVSPSDPPSIYVGSWGLVRQKYGISGWATLGTGLGAARHDFLVYPTQDDQLFLQDYGGTLVQLYKGVDGGKEWTPTESPGFHYFTFDDDGSLYGSLDATLYKYNSQTNSYDKFPDLASSEILRFYFTLNKPEVVLATGDPDFIFRSTNYGNDWEKFPLNGAFVSRLFMAKSDTIYSGSEWGTWRSNDYGVTWQGCQDTNPITDSATAIAVSPGQSPDSMQDRVLLATQGDGLMLSVNGCRTWKSVDNTFKNLRVNSVVFDPKDPSIAYAATDSGVYMSQDHGETWSEIGFGLPGVTYSLLALEDGRLFATTPWGFYERVKK